MTTSNNCPAFRNPSSILILTAAFGEGHNAASRNLRTALLERSPTSRVEIHDVFQESYGWRHEILRKGYSALINHLPAVWNQVFDVMDKTPIGSSSARIFSTALERLHDLLLETTPTVVINTFPGYGILLDSLHKKGLKRTYWNITLLTDSITINSLWYRSDSDTFITPNLQTSAVLEKAGIPRHKIHPLGFPVSPTFSKISTHKLPPLSGEKWKILYMVNAAHRRAPSLTKRLLTLKNAEITVTVGKNEALGKTLNQLSHSQQPFEIHGWTPHMPRLIGRSHVLIGKAGGATVQEALAGRTPLLITQIVPGQEEGNGQLILENGAGTFASKGPQIIAKLEEAFAEEGLLWKKWFHAASSLSQPNAALNIADFILTQKIQSS